jgi:hypothetical protein
MKIVLYYNKMGYNRFVATVLIQSVYVVAVYTAFTLMLLSCRTGMY